MPQYIQGPTSLKNQVMQIPWNKVDSLQKWLSDEQPSSYQILLWQHPDIGYLWPTSSLQQDNSNPFISFLYYINCIVRDTFLRREWKIMLFPCLKCKPKPETKLCTLFTYRPATEFTWVPLPKAVKNLPTKKIHLYWKLLLQMTDSEKQLKSIY